MQTEFECRFLKINLDNMREKLLAAGFVCAHPETLQRRVIFDIPDTGEYSQWIRLRDEGDKITLTLKQKSKGELDIKSLREIEIRVSDFEDMKQIFNSAGLMNKPVEENKREKWTRNNIEVCLDTWPGLDPFVEIESDSEDTVKNCAIELGFEWRDAEFGNVGDVYKKCMGLALEDFQYCCNFSNPPKSKL